MYHQNYISNCFKFDITLLERSSIYIKHSNGSKNETSGTHTLISSQLEFCLYVECFGIYFPGNFLSYHKFLKFLTLILNPHRNPIESF